MCYVMSQTLPVSNHESYELDIMSFPIETTKQSNNPEHILSICVYL